MRPFTSKKNLDRKASIGPEAIGPEAVMNVRPTRMEAVTLKKNLDRNASRGPEAIGPKAVGLRPIRT